jgi:hypothetical protein
MIRLALLGAFGLLVASCGSNRGPVPPQGTKDYGDKPWNIQLEGEGAGLLGGALQQR